MENPWHPAKASAPCLALQNAAPLLKLPAAQPELSRSTKRLAAARPKIHEPQLLATENNVLRVLSAASQPFSFKLLQHGHVRDLHLHFYECEASELCLQRHAGDASTILNVQEPQSLEEMWQN